MSDNLNQQLVEAAYKQHLAEIQAVPTAGLATINLDVDVVVAQGLEVFDRVSPLREEIQLRLPDFDLNNLDRLPGYALALSHAHTRCVRRQAAVAQARSLLAEATQWRAQFPSDAAAMAKRRLIEPELLARFCGVRSCLQVVEDLSQLTKLFRRCWDSANGRTAVTLVELDQAEQLTLEIRPLLHLYERQPEARATRQRVRAQAFTLFASAYDELQRAASYLHWKDGRGEHLVPPLRSRHQKRDPSCQSDPEAARISSIRLLAPPASAAEAAREGAPRNSLQLLPRRAESKQ